MVSNWKFIVHPDDMEEFVTRLNNDNVKKQIADNGFFQHKFRIKLNDEYVLIVMKVAKVMDKGQEKLIAGVRKWRERN